MPISMPIVWLIVFVVLMIAELVTYNLVTIWFALACIPVIFIAMLDVSPAMQVMLFAIFAAILLISTKKLVRKLQKKGDISSLVGTEVTVTALTSEHEGQARTRNGVTWNVVSADQQLTVNSRYHVKQVSGNTLIIG